MERAELSRWVDTLGCAERHGGYTFLRDPHWSDAERAAAEEFMRQAAQLPPPDDGWLCIRTGGSGGGVKFARHDEHTLSAAIEGFCRHFRLEQVNTVGVLPPWHVSGFMARLRCFATGGEYCDADWKELEAGQRPQIASGKRWVLSLVPTQLQRMLTSADAESWLRQFEIVFIGGGPVWPSLSDAAAQAGIRISLSYGMTETAAMVTAQLPSEFLAGDRSSGCALSHAAITIDADGRVVVSGASLFRGYFPEHSTRRSFPTQDIGRLDATGHLHLLSRIDGMIITGGKKVATNEVEAALRASGEFDDIAVLGLADPEWGEIVVACYPSSRRTPNFEKAAASLAPHQRPKRYIAIAAWPRNAQGKINRAALAAAIS